jgi:hypothetical protein
MLGYVFFVVFWLVFGVGYLTRDKSKDQERVDNFYQ